MSNKQKLEDLTGANDKPVTELTIEEQFQKMEHKEHALELPDTYIGSTEAVEELMWVIDDSPDDDISEFDDNESVNESVNGSDVGSELSESNASIASLDSNGEVKSKEHTRMVYRKIRYVPGLYKIYDEVLVNAIDHWTRMDERIKLQDLIKKGQASETPEVTLKMKFKPVKNIKIEINQEENSISVCNDGDGIPIAKHEEYGVYVPELLFSQFLTSGNYKGANVNQTKIIGGKNGYGAKLAALFSNSFTIETVDFTRHKKYIQTYRDNLNVIEEPIITDFKGMPYTKITFSPDLGRFGLEALTDDMVAMFKKRVYDATGWCTGVNVFLNDFRIPIRDFNQYTNLYLGSRNTRKRFFLRVSDRWELCATYSEDHEFQQVSIVNGILTSKGGRHVTHVADQIARKLSKEITTEKNPITPKAVRSNLWLFLRCVIENPNFDSQTKEQMTTQVAKFGSKCDISLDDIKKIGRVGITQRSKALSAFKETQTSKATDGKKINRVYMDKLEDAAYAGNKSRSHQCTLILTEGDSAKGFALKGLKALTSERRKYYGIFPLKGKMLNVRDANQLQIDRNAEIIALKRILALQSGVDYSGTDGLKKLRYGKIMILTDSDHDGDHIKGLVINFIHKFWPSLILTNKFITTMITPIVIVWKERKRGRKTEKYDVIKFYSENKFCEWKKSNNDGKGWKSRYYKGLATSLPVDAEEAFREQKLIQYITEPEEVSEMGVRINPTDDAINLAFLKTNADLRKRWLLDANLDQVNEYNIKKESYRDFINHRLVHFSWADTYRSIPNLCDGLKPSMRKIMYYCLKNNVRRSLKVAQLGGKVSDATAYHHGETSLEGTIIGLAQDYVGSNNINLLKPEGMFGTRYAKGKDAGSARYIYTKLEDMTQFIYRSEDSLLYRYLTDDGYPIEPEWYLPIIPMILVNGANGIGTGFSTTIHQYNPMDLIQRLRILLSGSSLPEQDPIPWYRGFGGKIERNGDGFICIGDYQIYRNRVRIKELPIDGCFRDYKQFLEELIKPDDDKKKARAGARKKRTGAASSSLRGLIKDISVDSALCQAEIIFKAGGLQELLSEGIDKFEKELKLRSKISVTNMTLFDDKIEIRKFGSVNSIIETFFRVRLEYYELRRNLLIGEAQFDLKRASSKYRFVNEIMSEDLVIYKKTRAQIIELLEERDYPKYSSKFDPKVILGDRYKESLVTDELSDDGLDGAVEEATGAKETYNYLLSMRIDSFSQEILEKLARERDALMENLEIFEKTTAAGLWHTDLGDFEKEYIGWQKDWYEDQQLEAPDIKPKKRIRVNNLSLRRAADAISN